MEVARELHYTPNANAQALKGQRTSIVAFVSDLTEQPAADVMFKYFISTLANSMAKHRIDLLIHPFHSDGAASELARLLQAGRADGLILADTRPNDERVRHLCDLDLPFVTFGRTDMGLDHPYIDVDGYAGTAAATQHLIDRGHRRIMYLGVADTYTFARHRQAGFTETLYAAGVPCDPALLLVEMANEYQLRVRIRDMVSQNDGPTAIVAASDLLAISAMQAVEASGKLVGQDVAVVGFDDLPLSAFTNPPLTTVRQPFETVALMLSDLLQGLIRGEKRGLHQVLLKPELVVRMSG